MTFKIKLLIHYGLLVMGILALLFLTSAIFVGAAFASPDFVNPDFETSLEENRVAENSCGAWQPSSLPASPTGWYQEYHRLNTLFAQCLNDADFLAYYGAIQLRTGQMGDALDTLERALLLNPNHGAAQMDYAQALFYTGDPFAAQALNQSLLNNRDLPPVIRQQINVNQKNLSRLLNTFTHQLNLSTGYETNLNTSPNITQLTLTLDGEEWLLALAEGMESRSGNVLSLGGSTRYTRRSAYSSHSVQLAINSRLSEYHEDHQHQFTARYQHQYDLLNGGELKHDVALITLRHGDKHIFSTVEVQQNWLADSFLFDSLFSSASACQFNPQHTLGYQDFPSRNNLNALEYRLTPAMQCGLDSWGEVFTGAELRLSSGLLFNYALDDTRTGGNRLGSEITASWQQPLPIGLLSLQARYSHWQDAKGYSGTLQNNAKREIKRGQIALAYLVPLTPRLLLTTQVALQRQTSNLELFEYKNRQFDLGIRWQF